MHLYNYKGYIYHEIDGNSYYYAIVDGEGVIFDEDIEAASPEQALVWLAHRIMERYQSSRYPKLLPENLHMVRY